MAFTHPLGYRLPVLNAITIVPWRYRGHRLRLLSVAADETMVHVHRIGVNAKWLSAHDQ